MKVMTREEQKSRKSPFRCPGCGKPASRTEHASLLIAGYAVECECSVVYDTESAEIVLRQGSLKYLDPAEVFNNYWWHTTDKNNWFNDIRNYHGMWEQDMPMVHLGTFNAACDRGRWEGYSNLFRIRLKNSAKILPEVWDDATIWPSLAVEYDYDIIRYINRWESAGSISLLVNPNAMIVAETRPYPAAARRK